MTSAPQLLVGLTGGIGSGKSAAGRAFAARGITVIDADDVAREVVEPGEPALADIAAHFGHDILHSDGRLNRQALRERVFADPQQRQWLESLLHPVIRQRILAHVQAARSAYVLLIAPLLVETGLTEVVDKVIVIDVDETTQIARTQRRDSTSAEQVQAIMAAQLPREERLRYADYTLHNDGTPDQLDAQVAQLHSTLLALAQNDRKNCETDGQGPGQGTRRDSDQAPNSSA